MGFLERNLVLEVIFIIFIIAVAVIAWFLHALDRTKENNELLERQKTLREENYSCERQRLIDEILNHRVALMRNIGRALKTNDYGAIVKDNRHKAVVEFLNSVDLDTDIIDVSSAIEIVVEELQSLINTPPTKEQHAIQKQKIIEETNIHYSTLMRNIDRAAMKNEYGTKVEDKREKVLIDFFKSIGLEVYVIDYPEAGEICVAELNALMKAEREKGFDINTLPDNGHEFEHWVAKNLNKFGWDAKVTVASGDQGIDVIAKKNGKTIGLQCKLLKSSVGNKAVQEAFAGKTFHKTDAVAVMSNAPYTPSAQKLATDTGVKLLSHHDIPNLYEKMFSE